ncbi:MAG TPA: ABC transporter substrate-binding protein [Rhodoferax sp.]|jgi:ABC-type branched-subunit amino acid transport system substrate-binding protein|nr:ABC transporter substrate-binding protein [Rhodoferax sp.]HNV59379.1 ABC transporter substrate-binding protein [Rhodoferax sp.]HPW28324.1 ABC transporter substrate-binding protein [Rhodoferax sp.]
MNLFHKVASLALVLASSFALAENGVTEREILIGQFAAISGPAAQLGQRMQVGMQVYFNAVNAQGGVHGRAIKLITRDDGYEPEKAVAAVKALIQEDRVFALAGSVGTPTGLAALPVLTEQQVPLVGMFTGAQALREPFNRYVFHVRASYFDETERIVQHLTTLGIKKIAVFYQNDAYGKAGLEGVTRALTKRQLKPLATATVERNSVDVTQSMETLLKSEPEAIVQISAYKSCAALIKQARAKGYGGQFFNVSFVGSRALADELGDAGQGVVISQVVPFPYAQNTPLVREYQQRMTEAGQKDFDFSSLEGYLTARVLVEGLRRAGKNLTRDGLIAGMESIHDVNLGGFTVNYSAKDHQASNFTDLTIIGRGGKFLH